MGGLLSKIKGARGVEWIAILAGLAIAVLLMARPAGDAGGGATDLEARLARVLSSIDGAGRVQVVINQEDVIAAFGQSAQPRIIGVLVVAEGADDLKVALELMRAVQALTGAERTAIEVMKMGKER